MVRLDAAMAERGLASSRTRAARLIDEGRVRVDGCSSVKASTPVEPENVIELDGTDRYVSRGALKLIAALDAWPIEVTGRLALDVGASTGGFTQVLRERGARHVIAVDVGHGQLDQRVAADAGVTSLEGVNARELTAVRLAELSGLAEPVSLLVGDLSFISLTQLFAAFVATTAPQADYVLLIKPQFEVGKQGVRGGIVRDDSLRDEAVARVLWAAWGVGLGAVDLLPSPLLGKGGNHEYLAWFRTDAPAPDGVLTQLHPTTAPHRYGTSYLRGLKKEGL